MLWTYLTRDQLPLLEQLPATVPDLPVVLNHLGFCPHGMRVDRHGRPRFEDPFPPGSLDPILGLAGHPAARVMFSGQYALSTEGPPYRDLDPVVRALAERVRPAAPAVGLRLPVDARRPRLRDAAHARRAGAPRRDAR